LAVIALSDLVRFVQLYPPGSLDDPLYAFAGGTALQCWLSAFVSNREYRDIDIYAFDAGFPTSTPDYCSGDLHFFVGGFTQDGIVAYPKQAPISLQITRSGYFDSEVAPVESDIRSIEIKNTPVLVLSPEFIAVSKLSYPNVHRPYDFQDILVLNQNGCLQDFQYLSYILACTSLGKLISAQDLLGLRTEDDLEALVDFIHRELIVRFLYWDYVNVDALDRFQFFVLLDVGDDLLHLPSQMSQFIEAMLGETTLDGRGLQIAKLGLLFLVGGIPSHGLGVLQNSDFRELIRRGLALVVNQPTFWLLLSKTIFTTLRQLARLEDLAGIQFDAIWSPTTMVRIMERILFKDPSRFILLSSAKAVCHDLATDQVSIPDCVNILYDLTAKSTYELTSKENCAHIGCQTPHQHHNSWKQRYPASSGVLHKR
jgi:hypothetical protein